MTDRLNTLNRLISKYCGHGGGLDQLLQYQENIRGQLAELKSADQNSADCDARIAELEKQLSKLGTALSQGRRKAAALVMPGVHQQLADLGMKDARFHIEFVPAPSAPGADASTDDPFGLFQRMEKPTDRGMNCGPVVKSSHVH